MVSIIKFIIIIIIVVDAADAGEGDMMIAIESAENRDLKCPSHVDVKGSQFRVTFTPTRGGKHVVNIRFNDKPIAGQSFVGGRLVASLSSSVSSLVSED